MCDGHTQVLSQLHKKMIGRQLKLSRRSNTQISQRKSLKSLQTVSLALIKIMHIVFDNHISLGHCFGNDAAIKKKSTGGSLALL